MSDKYRPSSYAFRHFKYDSDYLFNHFLDLRRVEQPDSLIERFHYLFIDGSDYPQPDVLTALHRIATSTWADEEFTSILNRCCYILINYWWLHPELREATIELVALFKSPYAVFKRSAQAERVRDLVQRFTTTEQYAVLQDRARIVGTVPSGADASRNQLLRNLIPRYPFLYPYCFLNWDSSDGGQEAVRQLQEAKERQFEQNLNRYLNFLLRRSRNTTADKCHNTANGSCTGAPSKSSDTNEALDRVENPTLLSAEQLKTAVKQFVGKAEGSYSYRDLARQFVACSREASSYQELKRQIYDYLTDSIQHSDNPSYGKHHFNRWLEDRLEDTFPQNDNLKPTSFLLVQTCAQLIEFLVANPVARPKDHIMFIDLINNLGPTFTVGLLLKLVLICRDVRANLDVVKAHMSKRFAVMLKHYETRVKGELEWLVECLDNLLIALSVHFGRADFSWVNLV